MIVELIRLENSMEHGTFGVLKIEKELFCFTLERPWIMNRTDVSCIPVGQYLCSKYGSKKHGTTFEVVNVPDRLYIIFHAGNVKEDSKGCIILGSKLGNFNGSRAVLDSKLAMKAFRSRLEKVGQFHLTVKNEF